MGTVDKLRRRRKREQVPQVAEEAPA